MQSFKYLQLAADQGLPEAQYGLGVSLSSGRGVAQDRRRGAQMFQLAADQGNVNAQHALSQHLFHGEGVLQSIELALKFCKLAASRGHEKARALLPSIKAALEPRTCAQCAAVEPTFGKYSKCGACSAVRYCGAACQRAHWKTGHKEECKQLARGREARRIGRRCTATSLITYMSLNDS